jgi:hypothetical protein
MRTTDPNLTATIKDDFVRALKDGLEDVRETSITLSLDKSAAPVPPGRRLVVVMVTGSMAVDLVDRVAFTAMAIDTLPIGRLV